MAISLIEALNILDKEQLPYKKEILCLEDALGRVAATNIEALCDLPNFDNSAMDGYAVRLEDAGKEVKVVGTILAGEQKELIVEPGSAVKIMTGAKLPKGCEAVVPIEDVEYLGERIILPQKIKENANMRFAGEDVAKGSTIVQKGERLSSYHLSLLASQGISYLEVFKKPKVSVFATGSELKMHYERLQASQIYNSNTPSFAARAKELGCEVSFYQKSGDDLESIKEAISNALDADLIVTSGGISVGEADFTKEAFRELGMEILFSKIDIKPGKPTTLGKIGSTYVLNLPGNPLAAQLNFELFARTLINRLRGLRAYHLRPIKAKLKEKLTIKPGRDTVIPGYFDGEFFEPSAKRAPGMVSVMPKANGFIIVDKKLGEVKKEVNFIPLWDFYADEAKSLISG